MNLKKQFSIEDLFSWRYTNGSCGTQAWLIVQHNSKIDP